MKKEFIPYKQALELKLLGFDEKCIAEYIDNGIFSVHSQEVSGQYEHPCDDDIFNTYTNSESNWNSTHFKCSAPTFSQAFRWFRDKCKVRGFINQNANLEYTYHFFFLSINEVLYSSISFNTYEEAELACLIKLIEIVKAK